MSTPEQPGGSRTKGTGPPASGRRATTAKSAAGASRRAPGATEATRRFRPALTSRAAVLALVVCVITLSLAYPLREYIAQRTEIAQLREERAAHDEEIARLRERRERLDDPDHVERQARTRLHYQYPGERSYIVLDGSDEERATSRSSDPTDPWFVRLWDSVEDADQAGNGAGGTSSRP